MLPNDFSFSSNLVIIYADPVPVRHRITDPVFRTGLAFRTKPVRVLISCSGA